MTRYPALEGLRIGCVKYLNSKPLICDYPRPVLFDHPARLAEGLAAGTLDAALVPVFEAFAGREYHMVDGVAIASRGAVYSVYLAYCGPLEKVRSVALDPASLTSVHLLKVLLQEFHGLTPRYLTGSDALEDGCARLLIGTQAIEFRENAPPGVQFLDLGEEWQRHTGLPFVFALWLLRGGMPHAAEVADDFRRLKCAGLRRLEEIVQGEPAGGREFAARYLTQHIRFDLGEPEKQAMALFRELALKHGFVQPPLAPFHFV